VGLGHLLEPIQSYCLIKDLPPLTILVVQEQTGIPGTGFTATSAEDLARTQLEVFEFDWLKHDAPSPEDLASALKERPSRGGAQEAELGPGDRQMQRTRRGRDRASPLICVLCGA